MLTRELVIAVYRQVLGHAPSEDEIAHHLGTLDSLEEMLRVALDSEEYAELTRKHAIRTGALERTHVNTFHPDLAGLGFPPGTRSADGVAIVGHEGWIFLHGGSNDLVDHYRGAARTAPNWLDRWRRLLDHRVETARDLGVDLAMQLLPDKLAVYEQHYPEPLERVGPRGIDRLLTETDAPLISPLEELQDTAAGGDVFLRTDTHLSFRGNALVAERALRALGAPVPADLADVALDTYAVAGDLGVRFEPRIVGPYRSPGTLGDARIVADNRAQIEAAGGHIGICRVFANERAPDPRVLAVFGGSHSFADPAVPGFCWFFAQVFREVHFLWVPFGWDSEYLRRVGANAVLAMGAERFVPRIPREEVDVAAFAEETLRSGRPVSVEQIVA